VIHKNLQVAVQAKRPEGGVAGNTCLIFTPAPWIDAITHTVRRDEQARGGDTAFFG
jgi:hypothetical protein